MARLLLALACVLFSAFPVHSAQFAADDFLPPMQATNQAEQKASTQVAQPAAVKKEAGATGQQAISAPTAQDAINAAAQGIAAGGGCEEVKFPSGFGFVASGLATYGVTQNPTANLLAQRQAYQIAYLNAKKNLAAYLNGISSGGKEQLQQQFKTVFTDTDTLSNISEGVKENIQEMIKGLLRGYVVYNVNDVQQGQSGTVTVTIVATPKTMGKSNRIDQSALTSENVRSGLNNVLAELASGLLPPVGGKIINVPQTGEIAFVGFGSAVIPDNPNAAAKAKLALNSQKVAEMRARSALCGIILGDELEASSSLDSSTQSMSKQYDDVQKDDPVAKSGDSASMTKLKEQVNSFTSTQLSNEQISSMRNGVVPPGVSVKAFFNPDKTIVEAVAVYLPSVSSRAAKAADEMKNSQIVQPDQSGQTSQPGTGKGVMPPKGASGQVSNAADL